MMIYVSSDKRRGYFSEDHERYVVGIVGQKRSGKDQFARELRFILQRDYQKYVNTIALAQPLTYAAHGFDHLFDVQWIGKEEAVQPHGLSYRETCRVFADALQERCGEMVFCDIAEHEMTSRDWNTTLVTDVRRHYEADWIRGMAGVLVKIDRGVEPDGHVTESEVPEIGADIRVDNTRSERYLMEAAKDVAAFLVGE